MAKQRTTQTSPLKNYTMKVSLASTSRELYDKVGAMQSKMTEEGVSLAAPDSHLFLPLIQNNQQTLES